MQIKKKDGTFNLYLLEVSFGELSAMLNALENALGHGPIADEMREAIAWYLDHIPGPGEDKDEFKAKKDAEKEFNKPIEPGEEGKELETGGPPAIAAEQFGPDLEPGGDEADKILPKPPKE